MGILVNNQTVESLEFPGGECQIRVPNQEYSDNTQITAQLYNANAHDDVAGRSIIILDDICDGGRTFIELSRMLKEKGANDIYLYVTHGIFSHGLDLLLEYFAHIYCYHTMLKSQKIDPFFLTIVSHP